MQREYLRPWYMKGKTQDWSGLGPEMVSQVPSSTTGLSELGVAPEPSTSISGQSSSPSCTRA